MNRLLWVLQVLLAIVFVFSGISKLMMPDEMLTSPQSPLPALFIRFISVCELLGAAGLVLPGLTHIRTYLTPLAAGLLTIIMIGATVSTFLTFGPEMTVLPLVVGLLVAFVAYGRWRLAPLEDGPRAATA